MLLCSGACQIIDRIGGRTVLVEFHSAKDVRGGEAVYLGDQRIGTTASPSVVEGSVRVPVVLNVRNRDALTPHTVFLLTDDPRRPERKCLVGYPLESGVQSASPDRNVYPGAANEAELALLMGIDGAKSLWDRFEDWISRHPMK